MIIRTVEVKKSYTKNKTKKILDDILYRPKLKYL